MANVEHSTLTGSDLHEPKGVAAASANEVYVANGSSSGVWTALQYTLTGVIANVSNSETVYVPIPYAGTVTKVVTVLEGAITMADATVTVSDSAAASMGNITVAFTGSAAGDVDTLAPSSNNVVTANDFITVATDGGSSASQRLWFTVVVDRS